MSYIQEKYKQMLKEKTTCDFGEYLFLNLFLDALGLH